MPNFPNIYNVPGFSFDIDQIGAVREMLIAKRNALGLSDPLRAGMNMAIEATFALSRELVDARYNNACSELRATLNQL